MEALTAVFVASFIAATLFPLPSEVALLAYLHAHPGETVWAVAVATAGNTLGGMTTYLIGRILPNRRIDPRILVHVQRWGAPATFLAWLPLVGDALCAAAGWLRVNWLAALAFMAAGRLSRYIVVAALA
jgi:membrane protein YqaA with SNARE-associated domain